MSDPEVVFGATRITEEDLRRGIMEISPVRMNQH